MSKTWQIPTIMVINDLRELSGIIDSQYVLKTKMDSDYKNEWQRINSCFFLYNNAEIETEKNEYRIKITQDIKNYEEYYSTTKKKNKTLIQISHPERIKVIKELTDEWNGLPDDEKMNFKTFADFYRMITYVTSNFWISYDLLFASVSRIES